MSLFIQAFWLGGILCVGISLVPYSPLAEVTKHGKLLSDMNRRCLVPKHFFYQFYVFAIIALLLNDAFNSLGGLLLLIHASRRLTEQLFLFPYSRESRMHLGAYLFGFFYYTGVACSFSPSPLSPALFLLGSLLQFFSHKELYKHRLSSSISCASGRKLPPASFLFKYMYCPHYFAEMVIYVSLCSGERLESIFCALFVVCSLGVNWRSHSVYYSDSKL